jgi:FAD-linked oxidoreductase
MKNWAGNIQFNPIRTFAPKSKEEIKEAVLAARNNKKGLRMRGSGHSWTGLITANDYYLHLDDLQGIISVNQKELTVSAWAGTKLKLFGDEGFKHKLAMENQGDINRQSLAGATSTGTHGTGITFPSIANQITALTIINGKGEEIKIEKGHPYFNAARLSLGSLGVISEITFKLIPAYKLQIQTFAEDFNLSLEHFDSRLANNRHLEMFYFPVGEWSLTKIMNETKNEPTPKGLIGQLKETILENWLYTQMNKLAVATGKYELIDKIIKSFVSPETKTFWSHEAFPTERSFKFMEMEYNLPVEHFREVMDKIRSAIRTHKFQTLFPIEIRFVKGDELWLSPSYQRDSVYFAVHTYISEDYRPYFECIEKIFQEHGGRPHWGKWHSMNAACLKKVYPKFDEFLKMREEFDPEGMFLNQHLEQIFGIKSKISERS